MVGSREGPPTDAKPRETGVQSVKRNCSVVQDRGPGGEPPAQRCRLVECYGGSGSFEGDLEHNRSKAASGRTDSALPSPAPNGPAQPTPDDDQQLVGRQESMKKLVDTARRYQSKFVKSEERCRAVLNVNQSLRAWIQDLSRDPHSLNHIQQQVGTLKADVDKYRTKYYECEERHRAVVKENHAAEAQLRDWKRYAKSLQQQMNGLLHENHQLRGGYQVQLPQHHFYPGTSNEKYTSRLTYTPQSPVAYPQAMRTGISSGQGAYISQSRQTVTK